MLFKSLQHVLASLHFINAINNEKLLCLFMSINKLQGLIKRITIKKYSVIMPQKSVILALCTKNVFAFFSFSFHSSCLLGTFRESSHMPKKSYYVLLVSKAHTETAINNEKLLCCLCQ